MSIATIFPPITSLLPHSGEMALLDQVISFDDENLCAEVLIRPDSLFCDGQQIGSWVGIEYMAQAIAAYAGMQAKQCGAEIKIGFLLGARRYESTCPAFAVGMRLAVHAHRALQSENGLGAFECAIYDADAACKEHSTALAKATVTVFRPDNIDQFMQQIIQPQEVA